MFVYNVKVNSKNIVKISLIIIAIIVIVFFLISTYKILSESFKVKDKVKENDISYIEAKNYSNILKSVYENTDIYIGQKVCFTGYIYRLIDFNENQFVLARNMKTNSSNQTLVVGFLCDYKNSKNFNDDSWVEVTGEIAKGNYHGAIPIVKVIEIKKVEKPDDEYVPMPDNTYIPTTVVF